MHVISQVGEAEGEGSGVFVLVEVHETIGRVRTIGVDDWTSTLDVNRALNVGRISSAGHVAVVKHDVGSQGDVLNDGPVVCAVSDGLDH